MSTVFFRGLMTLAQFYFISFPELLLTGDKFLCGIAVLALAGATWLTALVLNVCDLLLIGSCFCEEKCNGDQRKVAPRN